MNQEKVRRSKEKTQLFANDFVCQVLNVSKTGLVEILQSIKKAKGEITLIMHPNSIISRDQGADKDEINNTKYKQDFLPWFIAFLQNKVEMMNSIDKEDIKPVIIFVDIRSYERFRDSVEEKLGNYLSKYGVIVMPTAENVGALESGLVDEIELLTRKHGFLEYTNQIKNNNYFFAYLLLYFIGVKKVKIAGGFIGEQHPEMKSIFGRCLGRWMSGVQFFKNGNGEKLIDVVVTDQVIYKDGVDANIVMDAGYQVVGG